MHRVLKAVFVTLLAMVGVATNPSQGWAENSQVVVSVYNDAQVPSDTLIRAEARASRIFSKAGVEIVWLECASKAAPDDANCNHIGAGDHLGLRIIPAVASTTGDAVFGVSYLASDGTGRYSDVFWKRALQLHANSNVDLAGILGSVMAHEMGHLLLGSNAHAINGIMRAHWEPGELHRIAMGNLGFLPEQARQMQGRLASSKELTQTMLASKPARDRNRSIEAY